MSFFDDFQLSLYTDFSKDNLEIDTNCLEENTVDYSLLNDHLLSYLEHSYLNGITIYKKKSITEVIDEGKLELIKDNDYYKVDKMYYSFPLLIPKAVDLLDEIGFLFQKKLRNTKFENVKFIITSALRTKFTVKKLRKRNGNASKYSAHLHGTTFDIAYDEFVHKEKISNEELFVLKDFLAQTLIELRLDDKCWVTYEIHQACFHVVAH